MGQEKRPDLSSKTVSASLCQPKEKVLRKFFRPSQLLEEKRARGSSQDSTEVKY